MRRRDLPTLTAMSLRRLSSDQAGFTVIEVMVASVILLVGLLGTVMMLDQANSTTWSTKAREQAVGLQREVIEAARSVPYDELQPTSVVSRVQAGTALGDSDLGAPGWTVRRRGFTYSVSLGVCSVDDPQDSEGSHDPNLFCASGAGQTTASQCTNWLGVNGSIQGTPAAATAGLGIGDCGIDINLDGTVDNLVQASLGLCLLGTCAGSTNNDTSPDDYKRIVSLVTWDRGKGRRFALQSTTVPNPGLSSAPAVTDLTTTSTVPVTTGSSVPFFVTTSRSPTTVTWSVDGTPTGNATGALDAWTFDWGLGTVNATVGGSPNPGELLDGSYVIGTKAFDSFGNFGSTRAMTVTLNRRWPYKVLGYNGGRNGTKVDFEWAPAKERDLQGYRVYRAASEGGALICSLTSRTTCQDDNPPGAGTLHYHVVAVDKAPDGSLREGDDSGSITVGANSSPNPPTNLSASTSNGNTVLSWTAGVNLFDTVDYYRIYRDGTTFFDRYDRTTSASQTTWTDSHTNGTTHTYYVVAVDTGLAESTKLGPVTR